MYEKVEHCPVCHSSNFTSHIICEDYTVSHESFAIMKCTNCNFLLTSPRPDITDIGKYYESKDYISHTDSSTNLTHLLYKVARNFTLRTKERLLNNYSHKKRLLDYGCGTGDFLVHMNKSGWKTTGIEPNSSARSIAQSKDLAIYESLETLVPDKKFHMITLWHVLEHIHHLEQTILSIKKLLAKEGKLVIAVPNHESLDRQIYQEHWAAYDVPRHLYHFNQLTINDLLKYQGFTLEATIPMKLDAYYVSLLSERYKTGKTNYLRAFINGWKSNRWASKNNNNYSSLIYIFKTK